MVLCSTSARVSGASPPYTTSDETQLPISGDGTLSPAFAGNLHQVCQQQKQHVSDYPYKGGTFTGTLCAGKPIDGIVLGVATGYRGRRFDGVVKEGALAYADRTRQQRAGTVTPFQRELRHEDGSIPRSGAAVSSKPEEQLRRRVLNYDPRRYVPLTTDEKFEVTNDNSRRFFDTIFAKEMLTQILSNPASVAKLREFSDRMLGLFRSLIPSDHFDDWKRASEGIYTGEHVRLQQLTTQVLRATEAAKNLRIQGDAQRLCLDIYMRRYLNYLIDETRAYKNEHPEGIINSESDPWYFKRGRLNGDFAVRDSQHMGILRNVDQCPTDLRFEQVLKKNRNIAGGIYTRCPDRLHMSCPDSPIDRDPDSWLSHNFLSGNTPYVNGLSASMLREIGGLTYAKERLRKGGHTEDFLASRDMIPVVQDYFRTIASLYVYIDGGHSLFEIQSAFKQACVSSAFAKVFEDAEWAKIGQDLYSDVRTFGVAWRATQQFDDVVQKKKDTHQELLARTYCTPR